MKVFVSLLLLTSCAVVNSQEIPKEIIPARFDLSKRLTPLINEVKAHGQDLTSYLPNGYVKDGSVDYTEFLQKGLNENEIVVMPNFPVLINDNGLNIKSNSVIYFQTNSAVKLAPSNSDTYEMFRIHQVENVVLIDPRIIGDRDRHLGKTGEWGMGIAIRSSNNVYLYSPMVENCWGDGIYVGQIWDRSKSSGSALLPISKNIHIYNAVVNHNRRNGLSIVAADGIEVYNSVFANSNGTFPKSGIDIEPGPGITDNIKIVDCVTYNNEARGIDIMLRKLIKMKNPTINLIIENHRDILSAIGIRVAGYKDAIESNNTFKIGGKIEIRNPTWHKNSYGALIVEPNQKLSPIISINNVQATDKEGKPLKVSDLKNKPRVRKGLVDGNISIN